jgi:hypothetical protein
MPTKIGIYGVSSRNTKGNYKDYDISVTIDEDMTEEEAVKMVLALAGGDLYRRRGQRSDRITVDRIGVQREAPLIRLQPRDEKGRFIGYEAIGRKLWEMEGGRSAGMPNIGDTFYPTFAEYARARGYDLVTGTARATIRTSIESGQEAIKNAMSATEWRQERSGHEWRKTAVTHVKMPYRQAYFGED